MAQRDARSTGRESGGEESDQGVVRQPALSVEARARMRANPLDTLIRLSSERVRHATIIAATLATVLLGGIPAVLALHQYNDAKHSAVLDLQARVVALGAVVDTAFAGDIGLLETAAQSPAVQQRHLGAMNAYFRAIAASGGASFTNGIVWVDRAGRVESASRAKVLRSHASVADRGYFRQVVAADKPYISSGLIGALVREPLIAIAVPTHSANGRISGVLVGSVLLKSVRESSSALALGFGNIEVIDRAGQLLLAGLKPVSNHPLLARIRRMGVSGVVADTAGFTGNGSDAVAFALSPVPGWIVAIARPRSVLFGPATRALQLEFASVGAALLAVFAILGLIALRARRHSIGQATRARAWSGLTRSLASATSPAEVSDALLGALIAAFPRELAVVTLDGEGGARVASGARRSYAREVARDLATLDELARYGRSGAQSVPADSIGALRRLKARSERRLRSLHALPILNRGGQTVGTIAVVSPRAQREGSDWALLSSFADQSGEALERAQLFEHEHAVAVRLQRNLLPDRLPTVDAVTFAGLYHAGGLGVEVGGDWYDAVRRADGIIHLCVGDVSGRGIDAATIMGRQRSVFRAYAFECTSPAQILRRMLRHTEEDEMVTVACVSVDLYTGDLAYSCAGHPPPLLLDHAAAEPRWLDAPGAPPIGVAKPADIVEGHVQLHGAATLALYTDGLVERRGASIDEGIAVLGTVVARDPAATPDQILARISEVIGAPDDDVALVLATVDLARASFEVEIDADPALIAALRSRLRSWLEFRAVDEEDAADVVLAVSEACNNAIEHAYRDAEGTLSVRVTLDGQDLRAVIADDGTWREQAPREDRGHGLALMRALMYSVKIERDRAGTRVSLERRITIAHDAAEDISAAVTDHHPA